jgi:hypothetical protein
MTIRAGAPQGQHPDSMPAHIAQRWEGALRRAEAKKKARQTGDAPSNKKRMATASLDFHCSHIDTAGSRAIPRFSVVAVFQHA